jgi:hypothetical protein
VVCQEWERRVAASFHMRSSPFAIGMRVALPLFAVVLWAGWIARTAGTLIIYSPLVPRVDVWLYDWNVYQAAAGQLLDRTLYRVELVQPGHEDRDRRLQLPPTCSCVGSTPDAVGSRTGRGGMAHRRSPGYLHRRLAWSSSAGLAVVLGLGRQWPRASLVRHLALHRGRRAPRQ